ncbi:MAG: polyprenyl synthetase family protein [Ruminococcus sp.]|nr:polyprenyl synthetase family protein [Ruminococcus sp.]
MNKCYLPLIEDALERYLPGSDSREKKLIESMRYSLKAGGKRVRPMLVLEFNALCGGKTKRALPFACAVEMVHTYSLIHDDLPCMDDDDLRRGKPSNHKAFGEDTALLAGDALQTLAFEILTRDDTAALTGDTACRKAAATLAKYAGCYGMAGGQMIDLESEQTQASYEVIMELIAKKTACLLQAACELGCIAAGADDKTVRAAGEYGKAIGYAFQIRDDILDCISTDEVLGKPVGSDEANQKSTLVSLLGLEECKRMVDKYTAEAIAALRQFDGDTKTLSRFAVNLARRKK